MELLFTLSGASRDLRNAMVENYQLIQAESKAGIRFAFIIAELDFEHTGSEGLNHGPYLATAQFPTGQILKERYHGKRFNGFHDALFLKSRNNWSFEGNPRPSEQSNCSALSPAHLGRTFESLTRTSAR